jgi:hypothetical protein
MRPADMQSIHAEVENKLPVLLGRVIWAVHESPDEDLYHFGPRPT